jgi:hypothetical protein
MAEPMSLDSLEREAGELYARGLALSDEYDELVAALAQCLRDRIGLLRGKTEEAESPAARLAFRGLSDSDTAFAAGLKSLIDGGEQLVQAFEQCRATALPAVKAVEAAVDEVRSQGEVSTAFATAVDDVLGTARAATLLCTYTIGAARVLNHALLLAAHDGNARYLGRKEWARSQAFHAASTLLQAIGEKAAESVIVMGATALGVAAPPALLIAGLMTATKIVYGLSRQQAEEATKRLTQALNEFDRLYALELLNLSLTFDARWIAVRFAEADAETPALSRRLERAAQGLAGARFDLDGVLQQAAVLRVLRDAMNQTRSKLPD